MYYGDRAVPLKDAFRIIARHANVVGAYPDGEDVVFYRNNKLRFRTRIFPLAVSANGDVRCRVQYAQSLEKGQPTKSGNEVFCSNTIVNLVMDGDSPDIRLNPYDFYGVNKRGDMVTTIRQYHVLRQLWRHHHLPAPKCKTQKMQAFPFNEDDDVMLIGGALVYNIRVLRELHGELDGQYACELQAAEIFAAHYDYDEDILGVMNDLLYPKDKRNLSGDVKLIIDIVGA